MKNLRQYILEANEDDALDDMINDKDTNDKSSPEEDNEILYLSLRLLTKLASNIHPRGVNK